jgi:lipopolysaccharide transport system ATP-binding protein
MSNIVIRVEGLSKQYRIGKNTQARYKTLRESIVNVAAGPFRHLQSPKSHNLQSSTFNLKSSIQKLPSDTIWALKEVSFEVQQGDVIGVIGPNGAGKTTLLKILSRITEPTEGEIKLKGRVGSLLEVGTGFHPELTGRENIYLNGAILGMSKAEIKSKFDEIVAFAEIEKFLDAPVKHYSTGMGTRLAFAIAAHLEPEILLVDEVLSVGDMAFRKKCLGKMQDVSQEGRTVLLVSHEMNAIRRLCKNGIWLDKGRIETIGEVRKVVRKYEESVLKSNHISASRVERRNPPNSPKYFSWISLASADGDAKGLFHFGKEILLSIGMKGKAPRGIHFVEWFLYEHNQGIRIAWGSTYASDIKDLPSACEQLTFRVGPLPLSEGSYSFSLAMGVAAVVDLDSWHDAINFEILQCTPDRTGYAYTTRYAPIFIPYSFEYL